MNRRLQALALVPYAIGRAPGQRYRIEQWAPYLREQGIDFHFAPFAETGLTTALYRPGGFTTKVREMVAAYGRRARLVCRASDYDVVYLHREAALIGPAWLERVARHRNRRLVYDFDDAIWLRYVSPSNGYISYLKTPNKTKTICRLAAAITVGNETLAAYARSHNPSVTVVPSTVSLREYRCRPPQRPSEAVPTIGWTGSHSSAQYLSEVGGALRSLAQGRRFRFLVIGIEKFSLPGVDVECRPWRAATEVEDLWDVDIGIMPLRDDAWARGKCAMKAIQYMGVGIPAVVSPIGANREVVEDGVGGFHATDESSWVRILGTLLDSAQLRETMGAAGRRRVELKYSAEAQAPLVASLLRSVAA